MLRQRIITALVLAVVVIGSIIFGSKHWVSLLFAVVLFAAARELLLLSVKCSPVLSALAAALFSLGFYLSLPWITVQLIYWQAILGALLWMLIGVGLVCYRYDGNWNFLVRGLMLGLGLVLLWICVHGLVYLHQVYGWQLLLVLLTLVWIADIGAYFSGRCFGKHKLAVGISPGKTWEGVFGGIFANLGWMVLLQFFVFDWRLSLLQFLVIGLATSAISVVGDLFESVLKREAGVKDSGNSLPGHGGVLDRIDSVIAATPVFLGGLLLMGPV